MPLRLLPIAIGLGVLIALAGASPSLAAGQPSVPAWLEAHVGEGDGQIAPVVLERARALYQRKGVRNPCYFAMDATRPHDLGGGGWGDVFTSSARRKVRFAPSPPATAAGGIWGPRTSPTGGGA